MHAFGEAGWFESAKYLFLQDAGGNEGLVVLSHGLHHLWIGGRTHFTVLGRLDKNHDFHWISPGSWRILLQGRSRGPPADNRKKNISLLSVCRVAHRP